MLLIGNSGWTTSAKLRQVLVNYVARELQSAYESAPSPPSPTPSPASSSSSSSTTLPTSPAPAAIDAAIKRGFLRLDHDIVHASVAAAQAAQSKRAAVERLAPALSGSCALLSFYDSRTQLLRVACTGDSRAVLGSRSPASSGGAPHRWVATPLSEDQTGGTPSEAARLRAEHPGEEYVTHKGRVLGGLEPSRAFGDAVYKWSRDTALRVRAQFLGKSPPSLARTPPYVTAEPVVTTTRVRPGNGDFVVLATDGLWECLTNEEVVGLVGRWLDAQPAGAVPGRGAASAKAATSGGSLLRGLGGWFGGGSAALPVEGHDARGPSAPDAGHADGNTDAGQRLPVRQSQWAIGEGDARFVVEDANAATHLIRNALGGRDRDMVCALLSLPSPYSRRYRYVPLSVYLFGCLGRRTRLTGGHRDDLTVQVVFFGDGADAASGNITRNMAATAPNQVAQPKL